MLSLDNAYDEADLRAFDERAAQGGWARRCRRAVRRGVEDRWPEHRADLREPAPCPRRHARRRPARRGRHRQRPHDPVDSAVAARRTVGEVRSARRGVPAARVVRSDQRGAGRRPASRSTRTRATSPPGRCGISIPRWSRAAGSRPSSISTSGPTEGAPIEHVGAAVGVDGMGASGRAACGRVRRHRCRHRLLPRMGHEAAAARVRHRRRRRQARRPRAARAARQHGQVSALGDRVQVRGAAAADEAAADRGERRPHGCQHALRRARAGLRRRVDGVDGDAAQRRGHRPQGPARRGHRRHREGRRRHPESRRAGAQPAAGRLDSRG